MPWLRRVVLLLLFVVLAVPVSARPTSTPKSRRRSRHVRLREFDVRRSIELQALEDVQVRVPHPLPAHDAQGKSRPHTDAELRTLKGVSNLPGYQGSFESLKLRQLVKVYLSQQKPPSAQDRAAGGKASTDPNNAHDWKRLGYLVGMVVKIDSAAPTKKSKKKVDDRFSPEATDRFTIQLESLVLTTARGLRPRVTSTRKPATLGKHVVVTRIVILKDVKEKDD